MDVYRIFSLQKSNLSGHFNQFQMIKKLLILALICLWVNTYACGTSEYLAGKKCLCNNKFYKIESACSQYRCKNPFFYNMDNKCPQNSQYDIYAYKCVCKSGYVEVGGQCILSCKQNAVYYTTLNACVCNNGFIENASKVCVLDDVGNQILTPLQIKPQMFTTEIKGRPNRLIPTILNTYEQYYEIDMVRTKLQMLPNVFPKTAVFAYAGITRNGYEASYPGPAIIATRDLQVKVKYTSKLFGPHMFPVDLNPPFTNNSIYRNQIPVVTHLHGVRTKQTSDGLPEAFWTAYGNRGSRYSTQFQTDNSSTIYVYPNEQEPTTLWYHDHAMGITRLNAYAGLAGLYEIRSPYRTKSENAIRNIYGRLRRKFLVINDKTFKKNGDLFYSNSAPNTDFDYWMPEFFGNTMLVNGKVWPKMLVYEGYQRFIILNTCGSRMLNIYFQFNGVRLPFDAIRLDGNYYQNPVKITQFLLPISSRLQIIINLKGKVGDVFLKNNARVPYPNGDPVDEFTGTIMKFVVSPGLQTTTFTIDQEEATALTDASITTLTVDQNIVNPTPFPAFPEGKRIFKTLVEVANSADEVAAGFINGISFKLSEQCTDALYKIGETYDWYIINLTGDTHPMHIHLVNFQLVAKIPFDNDKYLADWATLNGFAGAFGFNQIPQVFDPAPYYSGTPQPIAQIDRVFRDVVAADPGFVTVVRLKFAGNDGQPFGFNASGMSFVWHCHILEHEDNDMMNYYCLE